MREQKFEISNYNGNGKYQRLLGGVPQTKGMKSGCVVLAPGESIGAHSTGEKEEAIIILEGRVQVVLNGAPACVAEQGQLVYIPPRTDHDMTNNGVSSARYIYVVSPVVPEPAC